MPPMSNQNNLQLFDISKNEELHLTELENSMIALNIIFQKVFKLPKSRWPAMKDKTINIPIFESDILNTIESLPRTPSNAGIIPINFGRKMEGKLGRRRDLYRSGPLRPANFRSFRSTSACKLHFDH